jgi:aspartyl-tRNA(Asn)/glutamyl-tRNA(Gln) amidotransferase subunit A
MHDKTIAELSAALRAGEFSALELTQALLARIEGRNPELNALITVTAEQALADARAADEARARGEAGPLTGIPIAHKDTSVLKVSAPAAAPGCWTTSSPPTTPPWSRR